jgi:hypothetical protein
MAEVQDFVTTRVEIYPSEWRLVRRLLSHVDRDETSEIGSLKLISDGTRRRWYATDWSQFICLEGEPDTQTYEILSPRASYSWHRPLPAKLSRLNSRSETIPKSASTPSL